MKKVLLIRHGEVEARFQRRYIGWLDAALSPEGRAACARLAAQAGRPDRIFTSPLRRARETAAIVFPDRQAEFIVDDRLKEMDFGDYADLTFDEIAAQADPAWIRCWAETPEKIAFPNGENYAGFAARVDAFFRDLPDGVSAVVTHGGVIMRCRGRLHGLPVLRHEEVLPARGTLTEEILP